MDGRLQVGAKMTGKLPKIRILARSPYCMRPGYFHEPRGGSFLRVLPWARDIGDVQESRQASRIFCRAGGSSRCRPATYEKYCRLYCNVQSRDCKRMEGDLECPSGGIEDAENDVFWRLRRGLGRQYAGGSRISTCRSGRVEGSHLVHICRPNVFGRVSDHRRPAKAEATTVADPKPVFFIGNNERYLCQFNTLSVPDPNGTPGEVDHVDIAHWVPCTSASDACKLPTVPRKQN